MKKIQFEIKNINELELKLTQSANEGDFISLKDLDPNQMANLFTAYSKLNERFNEQIKDNVIDEYKRDLENKPEVIRLINNTKDQMDKVAKNEIKELQSKIDKLNETLSKEKQLKSNAEIEMKAVLASQEDKLKTVEAELKAKFLQEEEEIKTQLVDFKNKIEQKEQEIKTINQNKDKEIQLKVENEISSVKLKLMQEFEAKLSKERSSAVELYKKDTFEPYKQQVKEDMDKLRTLNAELNGQITGLQGSKALNSKVIGNNFEWAVYNEINDFVKFLPDVSVEPITKNKKKDKVTDIEYADDKKDGTKADFIIKFFDNVDSAKKTPIASIVIEAKSELDNGGKKVKNKAHYDKLIKDKNKEGATYAFLVTELEKDNAFGVQPIRNEDGVMVTNCFEMRIEYLKIMIQIYYTLIKELNKNKQHIEYVENISRSVEYVSHFLSNLNETILRITNTEYPKLKKEIETIKKSSEKLEELSTKIFEDRIKKAAEYIGKYDINKAKQFEVALIEEEVKITPVLESK
ncbi:DUF2130 domain-containing protein [Mycoplasma sp. Pen4]|uniref:DUF2130 domain-containing protein n=1 Tax=Mycoplasma sp. Pen4 TaxID=640330 RepID=UPI0016540742|nr:DUF2130 domain-containing protein [Mycoplasma sp. Pen4]QNM93632.1 DUF2130 domain-containing protein [Mycoplasma sp. Pen4]